MAASIFYYTQLIKHYASATFIDVLHSPFVFNLYQACFAKYSLIQLNSFDDLQGSSYIDRRVSAIIVKLQLYFKAFPFYKGTIPINDNVPLILEIEGTEQISEIETWIKHMHNDSIVVIRNPRTNPIKMLVWEHLQMMPETTALIDLYFLVIACKRKEQRKQIFKLRLF